jgi:hypothetical protein
MKLNFFLIVLLSLTGESLFCQKLHITGSIIDSASKPVPMASVTIEKTKQGIAADETGRFNLSVSAGVKILVSAIGFKDTLLVIKNAEPLNIILKHAEHELSEVVVKDNSAYMSQVSNQIKNEIFQAEALHYKMENNLSNGISVYEGMDASGNAYHVVSLLPNSHIYQGSALPEFHSREDTKGSIYLFDVWMKGIVANANDSTIVDDAENFYNINKITGELMMTRDFSSGLSVDSKTVKFFILFDSLKNLFTFLKMPAIDARQFCEVISLGSNYDIVRLTTTKFVKADFHSDGIASTGNNYDEYADTKKYYLMDMKTGNITKFDMKKKDLKQAFAGVPGANDYFTTHKSDEFNDAFLKGLGESINTVNVN